MIKQAALIALLGLCAAGCEHPSEPNGSAEMRAGIDGSEEGERPRRGVAETAEPEGTMMPAPGPRTNTPGGAASDLHSG